MKKRRIVIFGSAEMASLARYYFEKSEENVVKAFTVDDAFVQQDTFEKLPIVPWSELQKTFPCSTHSAHVALSYKKLNRLREHKFHQVKNAGYNLLSYISPNASICSSFRHGDNCLVLEDQTIQRNVVFEDNVMAWSGNHFGHGSVIGSHTYVSSHVVISGNSQIGQRCFFGVNAAIKDFSKIGDDCLIGMGTNITKDMKDGSVAINPPSSILDESDRRAKFIVKSYFG